MRLTDLTGNTDFLFIMIKSNFFGLAICIEHSHIEIRFARFSVTALTKKI